MISLFTTPLEIARSLADSARALAELPVTLERTLRETNALIADARAQLTLLGDQVKRMMEQLEKMGTLTDRLVDGVGAITGAAQDAQRQIAATAEQLGATNRTLEQIVRMAEPLDRMGKRLATGLLRVSGRRSTSSDDDV